MPLSMMNVGQECEVVRIGGKDDTKRFLESLGFVPGGKVTVVSEISGNLIVNVKESRVAISREMANNIAISN
ncbi:MAG TPA: ferrous iron transport protein A [Firmicutes bacterium]|nr:ferrous iron transport protein A [Bacillota bacterium]